MYFELILVAVMEEETFVGAPFTITDDDDDGSTGNDELVEYVVSVCTKYIGNTSTETSPRGLMD
jgi:hypothetical protein